MVDLHPYTLQQIYHRVVNNLKHFPEGCPRKLQSDILFQSILSKDQGLMMSFVSQFFFKKYRMFAKQDSLFAKKMFKIAANATSLVSLVTS
jgi:hypothetical protein